MADDQEDVKEGEEQPVEPSATEEPTEEVTEPTEEEASEPEEEETETVPEGKGANQRIRELNQKAKAAEAKAQSLEERIAELTGSVEPTGGFTPPAQIPHQPIVKPGEELTAEELDRRIQEREQRLLSQIDSRQELARRQDEAVARHRNETSEVANLYPQLNPKSEQFNPELSEAVTEAVEAQLKASPYTASVKKIVDKLMKPYLGSVANEVGKERENIAKQVSQSALRPTSVRKAEKGASEKSIAELEAELGIVQT